MNGIERFVKFSLSSGIRNCKGISKIKFLLLILWNVFQQIQKFVLIFKGPFRKSYECLVALRLAVIRE